MLKWFNTKYCKPMCNPMIIGCKLRKEGEAEKVSQKFYISMIGNLLYVISSRKDVMHAIGLVVRFQLASKETHVHDVKRFLGYLKENLDFGLRYQ